MDRQTLQKTLQRHHVRLSGRGFDVRELVFAPPATEMQLAALEMDLGMPLPLSFRNVVAKVSAHVEFRWFCPREMRLPEPFKSNFSGDLHWSLDYTRQFNRDKQGWIDTVFKSAANTYDSVWHNKLAFYEVGNGDYIAMSLARDGYGEIVYLSHDDGAGHGYVLADSFADLLERWVPLACPGGEDWQWLPFVTGQTDRIDPKCQNARDWRRLLTLDV